MFKVDLSDKVVAITGAGGVICGEFARALAEIGAKLYCDKDSGASLI
ncbi:MAG: hypothetical protein J5903_00775 [Clostridia bacterium]|nr:hypothetical protein [Clostridia bacterium]